MSITNSSFTGKLTDGTSMPTAQDMSPELPSYGATNVALQN
jgi:hypothetical protein